MPHPILTDLETIASSTAADNGFALCGVQIRHSGGGDVSLEECASFSEPMGQAIETSELINEAYVLEVSSPGINDQLNSDRDFQTFKGFPVEITFQDQKSSPLHRTGLLHERSKDYVHLNIKGRISKIPRNDVIEVRLTSPTG